MGLFDTVIIEKLKLEYPPEVDSFLKARNSELPADYQTKDLDCAMCLYKITEDGQLWKENRIPNGKKEKRKPWPRFQQDLSFLERLYWDYKDNKLEKKMDELYSEYEEGYDLVFEKDNSTVSADLYYYELIQDRYLTLDYRFVFVNGKVTQVTLTNYEIETDEQAQDREKRDKRLDEDLTARRKAYLKLKSQWYYPLIKEVYNPGVFLLSKFLHYTAEKLRQLSYRLRKY